MASLKGKLVQTQPAERTDTTIAVPKELIQTNLNMHMHINIMQVNRVKFFTTIGYPSYYQKTAYLESDKAEEIYSSLDIILRCYNGGGHKVSNVTCDNSFRAIFEDVSDNLDVTMEYANPQDHKPHIKRNNRIIKNQVRTDLHSPTHPYSTKILCSTEFTYP